MESLRNEASEEAYYVGKKIEESVFQWAGMLKEVVDKLTEKNMEVTHNFQNFEINIPKATSPEGKELGSAKWRMDGKFTLTTQLSNKSPDIE
jgi:hypothetical protein